MNAPLRVLHVHSGNLYGGVETLLMTLARADVSLMATSFALCFNGRFATELQASGATIERLGPTRLSRPWTVWKARRRLARLLRASEPDLVIFHSGWSQAAFAPVASRSGIPTIRWMHGPMDDSLWLERWARRARPALLICNSRFTAASVARAEPTLARQVLYPPVTPPPSSARAARARLRHTLGVEGRSTVIALVGRMEPLKGHGTLLRALAPLAQDRNWAAWIVGGPQRPNEVSYLRNLRHLAEQLGLARRVRFLGERTDVAEILAASDLYCQPNTAPESFGITFVEALYAGLPVVTFDFGGPSEIVDQTCGALIPPGDVQQLSVALQRLVKDEAERRRLGAAAPARARALCDPEVLVPRLAELLRRGT